MEIYVDIGLSFWDFVITVALFWAVFKGYRRGAIVHSVMLLVLLAGIGIAAKLSYGIYAGVQDKARVPLYNMPVVIFALLFIVAVVGSHIIGNKVMDNVGKTPRGFTNRILGIAVSVVKYLFILSASLIIIYKIDINYEFISQDEKSRTKLFYPVMNIAPSAFKILRFQEVHPIPKKKPDYLNSEGVEENILDDF
ncbi:MAG: CvpA family protein [Bacteroidota bacterium]|nr:CvpA family protein [Bacteroidota bacterium]